jgi:hypothetical protein
MSFMVTLYVHIQNVPFEGEAHSPRGGGPCHPTLNDLCLRFGLGFACSTVLFNTTGLPSSCNFQIHNYLLHMCVSLCQEYQRHRHQHACLKTCCTFDSLEKSKLDNCCRKSCSSCQNSGTDCTRGTRCSCNFRQQTHSRSHIFSCSRGEETTQGRSSDMVSRRIDGMELSAFRCREG